MRVDLEALYTKWSRLDPNFRKHAPRFTGIRILNQDAWETLISFICSSNNNISRISQMVRPEAARNGSVSRLTLPRSTSFASRTGP